MENLTTSSAAATQCNNPESQNQTLRAALKYAGSGIPVVPCRPDKSTHHEEGTLEQGFRDATTDPERIKAWWRKWPHALIGVPGGEASGVWTLDLDLDPKKGLDGYQALERLERQYGKLPDTRRHGTPRGGAHLLFRHDPRVGARRGSLPKDMDVRGEGAMFIVPPSGAYTVEHSVEMQAAPEWLIGLIQQEPVGGTASNKPAGVSTLGDDELLQKARSAANGGKFRQLYDHGSWQSYPSHSEADQALVSLLGFWTCGDREQTSRLFKQSALYRAKGKGRNYVERTVDRTLGSPRGDQYDPRKGKTRPPELDERVEELSATWYESGWERTSGKNMASLARHLLTKAQHVGEPHPEGLRVEESYRDAAVAVGVHKSSIIGIVKRLEKAGVLRRDNENRRPEDAGALVLLIPERDSRRTPSYRSFEPRISGMGVCGMIRAPRSV